MRKIIFLTPLFFLPFLFVNNSYSANTLTYEIGQEQQKEFDALENDSLKIKKMVNTLNLSLEEILPMTSFNTTIRQERPDYSTFTIRGYDVNSAGLIIPNEKKDKKLSETSYGTKEETWLNSSVTVAKGPWSVTLGGEKNITYSPFGSYTLNNLLSYSFYNQTTIVSLASTYSKKNRPFSLYTTPMATIGFRPTTLYEKTATLAVEQTLTELDKVKMSLGFKDQTKERPQNYSIGTRWAHAFSDRLYGKLGYTFARERQNVPLKNERGYFTKHIAETEATIEPIYDLLVSVSYDMIVEDEKDPRMGIKKRVGADQFGLGVKYLWNSYLTTNLRSSYLITNKEQKSFSGYGGIECAF